MYGFIPTLAVKRHILLNLTHFDDRHEELVSLYAQYALHPDVRVRFDAFSVLSNIASIDEYLETCRSCLRDGDQRVRALALHQLAKAGTEAIRSCRKDIQLLLAESDFEIRKAALKILQETCIINTVSP